MVTSFTTDAISSAGFCIMASAFCSTNYEVKSGTFGIIASAVDGERSVLSIRSSNVGGQKSRGWSWFYQDIASTPILLTG